MPDVKKASLVALKKAGISAVGKLEGLGIYGVKELTIFLDSFVTEIDSQIKNENNEKLFNDLFSKYDDIDEAVNEIKQLLGNPDGILLYKKIINLLGNKRCNDEYITLLSNILHKILKEDNIEDFFNQQSFIIDLIEKLSSDALIVFIKFKDFSDIKLTKHFEVLNRFVLDNNIKIGEKDYSLLGKQYNWNIVVLAYFSHIYGLKDFFKNKELHNNIEYLSFLFEELYDNMLIENKEAVNNISYGIKYTYIGHKVIKLLS